MPKRKPPRSQRRGARPAPAPPPQQSAPLPALEPLVAPATPREPATLAQGPLTAAAPASAPAQAKERSISRFTVRDYTYVRRELLRIAILAVAIFITIVVLSFFLP